MHKDKAEALILTRVLVDGPVDEPGGTIATRQQAERILGYVPLDRLVVILNRRQLVNQDLLSVPLDHEHVVWLFVQRDVDILHLELFLVGLHVLFEDLLDIFIVQDVIVWHFERQFSKSVSLVNGPDLLVEEQLDQVWIAEAASLVQSIVTILIT